MWPLQKGFIIFCDAKNAIIKFWSQWATHWKITNPSNDWNVTTTIFSLQTHPFFYLNNLFNMMSSLESIKFLFLRKTSFEISCRLLFFTSPLHGTSSSFCTKKFRKIITFQTIRKLKKCALQNLRNELGEHKKKNSRLKKAWKNGTK